jgi:hypothetical protein
MLFALSILHATLGNARAVQHVFFDGLIELRMDISVGNLGGDEGVDLFRGPDLVIWLQEDEEVHVRQTTLLVFDGVHQSRDLSIAALSNLLQ